MLVERQTEVNSIRESNINLLHDVYGRSYQAKALSSFTDYTLLPHLYRYRGRHLLRCLGLSNTDNADLETVSDLRTGLLLNQMGQIDLKEDPAEIVVLFEHLSGLTLRQFSIRTVAAITEEISLLYERFFDQILSALEDFAELSGVGLWHGDISPDNIMITAKENAVLIDFDKSRVFLPGYSKLLADDCCNKAISLSGTPGYTSKLALKEQAELSTAERQCPAFVHDADRESLGRSFVAALIKKPGSTLTAADIKSALSQVQPGFAYKLLSALCASVSAPSSRACWSA